MKQAEWTHESALTMGCALWSVKQTHAAPNSVCPLTGKPIERGRAWTMYHGYQAVHESAEGGAPEILQVCISELNRMGKSDLDDPQCAIAESRYFQNEYCPMVKGRYLPISKREVDACVGARQGERLHGVSPEGLHKLSPTIERWLCARFGAEPWQPPAPPAPPSADEIAKQQATERKFNAVVLAAKALTGNQYTSEADFQRAVHLFESMKIYLSE